jgi:ABC-type sugar transport system substrate-binding protein
MEVRWTDNAQPVKLSTNIEVMAVDRVGLLFDVARVISESHVFIENLNSRHLKNGNAVVDASVQVDDVEQLNALMNKIRKQKGVISVDRAVNGVEIDCQIASDNVLGAELATQYIVDNLGEGVKVAELEGVPGASAAIDRSAGFHNVADKKLDVVAKQTANFDRAQGMSVMENMLQANGDIKAVFAANDEMALGAIAALEEAGYNKSGGKTIPVFGIDATEAARSKISEGKMAGTVRQDGAGMAAAIMQIIENFKSEKTPLDGIDEANTVEGWRVNIPYSLFTGEK